MKPQPPPGSSPASTDIVKFGLGEFVHRKLQPDVDGMVTGIMFRPEGVLYYCTFAELEDEVACYAIELESGKQL